MELSEAFSFLLADSFMSALILPFKTPLVFPVMKLFGGYNGFLMVITATIGTLIGHMANFFLGRFTLIASGYKPENKSEKAQKFFNFCKNKGPFLLVLSWVPILGSIIAVMLGFVRISFKKLILGVFAANLAYYCFLIVT
jgi:membrane protein YqaA with SNARE-associated domain